MDFDINQRSYHCAGNQSVMAKRSSSYRSGSCMIEDAGGAEGVVHSGYNFDPVSSKLKCWGEPYLAAFHEKN